MNIIKKYSIGSSKSITLAQNENYKFVVGTNENYLYVDLVDKSTGEMVNNFLMKSDESIAGRSVDNRAVVLFSHVNTVASTITLPQPYTDFKKIVVFYNGGGAQHSTALYTDIANHVSLSTSCYDSESSEYIIKSSKITFTDKTVSFSASGDAKLKTTPKITFDYYGAGIRKIVGYKHL